MGEVHTGVDSFHFAQAVLMLPSFGIAILDIMGEVNVVGGRAWNNPDRIRFDVWS